MMDHVRPYVYAVIFLAVAIITGRLASEDSPGGNEVAKATVSAGTGQLGVMLADLLWIKIDNYHHIMMYQGYEWTAITEYMPQLWLVIKLNPSFPDAYIDGGHHLAVNLGFPEEGLELLDRGIINCPDDERVFWERLMVLWRTGYRGVRATRSAAWDYLKIVRRKRGRIREAWNEANAVMIIGFTFRDDESRINAGRLAARYEERARNIRRLRHLQEEDQS